MGKGKWQRRGISDRRRAKGRNIMQGSKFNHTEWKKERRGINMEQAPESFRVWIYNKKKCYQKLWEASIQVSCIQCVHHSLPVVIQALTPIPEGTAAHEPPPKPRRAERRPWMRGGARPRKGDAVAGADPAMGEGRCPGRVPGPGRGRADDKPPGYPLRPRAGWARGAGSAAPRDPAAIRMETRLLLGALLCAWLPSGECVPAGNGTAGRAGSSGHR